MYQPKYFSIKCRLYIILAFNGHGVLTKEGENARRAESFARKKLLPRTPPKRVKIAVMVWPGGEAAHLQCARMALLPEGDARGEVS